MFKPILYTLGVPSINYAIALSSNMLNDDDGYDDFPSIFSLVVILIVDVISLWLLRKIYSVYIEGPSPFPNDSLSANYPLKDRVVMITGANAGIGKETASQILEAGATVVFACRSEGKAREAMENIASLLEPKLTSTSPLLPVPVRERMIFLEMDLSDLESIRCGVEKFLSMNLKLHVLINNAGVMMGEKRLSKDQFELTMQANHLGHFLLTNLELRKIIGA